MAFDPNKPASHSKMSSLEMRQQFTGLKAIIDDGSAPVGSVTAWLKSFPNTPPLPSGWAECHGQVLNDAASPYHGAALPDLNGAQGGAASFLRGATASGGVGGSETHTHGVDLNVNGGSAQQGADFVMVPPGAYNTADAPSLPTYYEVVWVMRVK